jgi:L-asparaginase II
MTTEVIQTRGGCVEAVHSVSGVAVCDNRVVWRVGDDRETAFRSASKPFQLACSLSALSDPEVPLDALAVGAASHSGEPQHTAIVERVLAWIGASAEGLQCGAHAPMHAPSAEAVLRSEGCYTALHNNCSGKHAFMLAACVHNQWPLDYRPNDHPLQHYIARCLGDWTGVTSTTAIDGCGVPTFVQSLTAVARAWWRVAASMEAVTRGTATDPWELRLGRIGLAMAAHPELTSGTGRLDLDVVRHAHEPMAVKIGAAGLFCIALPRRRTGIAVKVHSGVGEALPALVAWALAEAAPGSFTEPVAWEHLLVRNVVGREVGRWSMRT